MGFRFLSCCYVTEPLAEIVFDSTSEYYERPAQPGKMAPWTPGGLDEGYLHGLNNMKNGRLVPGELNKGYLLRNDNMKTVSPKPVWETSSADVMFVSPSVQDPKGIARLSDLVDTYSVLEAESHLIQMLERLKEADDAASIKLLLGHPSVRLLMFHMRNYMEVGRSIQDMKLACNRCAWEDENTRVWMEQSEDGCECIFTAAITFDVPLHQCLVAMNELDLQTRWQTSLSKNPHIYGMRHMLRHVTKMESNAFMFTMEFIVETLRFVNTDYGSLVERIRSQFPKASEIAEVSWFAKRVEVSCDQVWVPHGGQGTGTLLLMRSRFDLGFSPPASVLDYVVRSAISDVQKAAVVIPTDVDQIWKERLREDQFGFYDALRKVERAAQSRDQVSLHNLPGREVVGRKQRLEHVMSYSGQHRIS